MKRPKPRGPALALRFADGSTATLSLETALTTRARQLRKLAAVADDDAQRQAFDRAAALAERQAASLAAQRAIAERQATIAERQREAGNATRDEVCKAWRADLGPERGRVSRIARKLNLPRSTVDGALIATGIRTSRKSVRRNNG